MNTRILVLPTLCLGGAALLLAPARPAPAFSKIGGSLNDTQRDVRVFDNFLDLNANNNVTPTAQMPGYLGVELAVWKGIVEWGSQLHGDGTGDPLNSNLLGNGTANFDAFWAGNADGIGTTNNNIVSSLADCGGGGTLAFTETPISDGWRIRYCDEWNWDDGPGTISNRFDIQGVMCHEYGHALGLGHSNVNGATMFPSVGQGQTGIRSIAADDTNGIVCVYGTASVTKPHIVATVASGGSLTIHGSNFAALNNEVWFTSGSITASGSDPIVKVTGVSSNGSLLTVTIPGAAGPGDVMVKKPGSGGSVLSNAFPTDLVGTFGNPPTTAPDISNVSPSVIDALIPGSGQSITITGSNFLQMTDLLIDGTPIDPLAYGVLDDNTIALDMPQVASLGSHSLGATDGVDTDEFFVTVVAPSSPKLQWGTGDALNVVDRDNGLTIRLSGTVGTVHHVYVSFSNTPSVNGFVNFGIGANFSDLTNIGHFAIPASGVFTLNVPTGNILDPGPGGLTLYSQSFQFTGPAPFPVSNVQSIFLTQ